MKKKIEKNDWEKLRAVESEKEEWRVPLKESEAERRERTRKKEHVRR